MVTITAAQRNDPSIADWVIAKDKENAAEEAKAKAKTVAPTATAPLIGPILSPTRPQVPVSSPVIATSTATPDNRVLQGPYLQYGNDGNVTGAKQGFDPATDTISKPPTTPIISAQDDGLNNAKNLIDKLVAAQKAAAIAGLTKSRDSALSNLSSEKAGIQPRYFAAKNQVAAGGQQQSRNFAEYMAARGGSSAGSNAQATISNNMTTQGGVNNLSGQETQAYTDIDRRTTDVNNAFESDKASTEANIEATRMKALLEDYYSAQQRGDTLAQNDILNKLQQSQQTFNQNMALSQQAQDLKNSQFAQQMQIDEVAYRTSRDAILDDRYKAEFESNIKQLGFENAIKKAVTDNQISNDKAQIVISRQNASTSAASQGNSANNSEQARLMDIWQATGKAPAGIPGVPVGTPIYEKPSTTVPKVEKPPTAEDYDKNIKPITDVGGKITNLQQIEDQIIVSGLSDWEQYKLYIKYGIHWDDPIPSPGK